MDIRPALDRLAAVGMIDRDGKILEVNEKFARLLGEKADELKRRNFIDFMKALDRYDLLSSLTSTVKLGLPWQGELCFLAKNTQEIWLESALFPIKDEHTDSLVYQFIGFNVTERKKVETALERAQTLMNRITDLAPIGFLFADQEGLCTYVNREWLESAGVDLRTALGEGWLSAVVDSNRAEVKEAWTSFVNGQAPFELEYGYLHSNGVVRTVRTSATTIPGPDETIIVRVEKDVTLLKQREATINEQRAKIFNTARLQSMMDMASGVAHEINNPIAVIKGKANQIIRNLNSGSIDVNRIQASAESIDQMGDRVAQIIKSLIFMTASDNQTSLETRPLKASLEPALSLVAAKFEASGARLELRCEDPNIPLKSRTGEITQLLYQLLSNALEAVLQVDDRWTLITVQHVDSDLLIRIQNSGPKIEPMAAARLFEPFYTTREPGKGMGLGLCIARSIALSHGGSLNHEAEQEFTSFLAKLPLNYEGQEK